MPLASSEDLKIFKLGTYTLQAEAPEELEEGVTAAFRFFFFKQSKPLVQVGRVTPDPITLNFKFNGDWALDAARALKRMTEEQRLIPLKWANRFDFRGYLTSFRFRYTQQLVTGTLTYQPISDEKLPGAFNAPAGAPVPDKAGRLTEVNEHFDDAFKTKETLASHLLAIKALVADNFSPITSALEACNDTLRMVSDTLSTVADIAAIPFQLGAEIATTINSTIGLLPAARNEFFAKVLAPVTPLLQGADAAVAKASAEFALVAIDDLEIALLNLLDSLSTVPVEYVVQVEDTLEQIADWFRVTIEAILQMNPSLSASTLVPGLRLKVPYAQ
ncbi:LysM peptidoglycan-binding domain-containing protein [bacterium]|nr:LysM peptidoglycan-binding domain-containing protein [bacterium]